MRARGAAAVVWLGIVVRPLAGCSDDVVFDDGFFPPPPPDQPLCGRTDLTCDPNAPLGQQGCATGEKCSWANAIFPECRGGTFCGPDGNVAIGDNCSMFGGIIAGHNWDDCVGGAVCTSGVCLDICGFEDPVRDCGMGGTRCTAFEGLFDDAGPPRVGVCDQGCDPLAQRRWDGSPCPGGKGCYLFTSRLGTASACAEAGNIPHGGFISGQAFANVCVPGAQPQPASDVPGNTAFVCGGLCRPADVTAGMNLESEGGVGADSCSVRWGAASPDTPISGESCRYFWALEPFPGVTPYSNTVGWCFRHGDHAYDSDGDTQPDRPFPRCGEVTTGDVLPPLGNPPHNDALYFWCVAAPGG